MTTDNKIHLHPTLGVNAHVTHCTRCAESYGLVMLGIANTVHTCNACDFKHVGYHKEPDACAACKKTRFTSRELHEGEKIYSGVCEKCQDLMEQGHALVKAGGIFWRCVDCKSDGALSKDNPFSALVREKHNVPAPNPIGISLSKKNCPVCPDEVKEASDEKVQP